MKKKFKKTPKPKDQRVAWFKALSPEEQKFITDQILIEAAKAELYKLENKEENSKTFH